MLQKTRPPLTSKSSSAAIRLPVSSLNAIRLQSKRTINLFTAISTYAAVECLAVTGSAYFIAFLYHGIFLNTWRIEPHYLLAAIVIATFVFLTSLGFQSFTSIRRQPRSIFLSKGVGAVGIAFSIFLSLIFIAKYSDEYSRVTFISQIIGVAIVVAIARLLFYSWLQSAIALNQIEARRVALIGDSSHCSTFTDRLKKSGIQTIGCFHLPIHRSKKGASVTDPELYEMVAECRSLRVDDVIILADRENLSALSALASSLAELPAGIHIFPVNALNVLATSQVAEFGNVQTIQLYRPPLSVLDLCIKRTFDLVFATIGLIVLSPLLLIVAIAIKLESRGPVLFRQTRHGFNNEEINVFKFRSMHPIEDDGPFKQAVQNDPRLTRIGRIIRKTNIDELPQLFNVLRGNMSIVGPRPHATAHNALFKHMIAPFSRRHSVKPGITGWAQVNGFRGATDTLEKMQQRIEYDLQYVDNWSFFFDMKIILMTLLSKKAYSNAY
jgi:Undecaprenyl-phosphate glucose phosphotransferase